jgi:hypothetical protein
VSNIFAVLSTVSLFSLKIAWCWLLLPSNTIRAGVMMVQVVEVLNPLARDQKAVDTMRADLSSLQEKLSKAHSQVHVWPSLRYFSVFQEVRSSVLSSLCLH